MKIKLELFGASKDLSDKEFLEIDLKGNSSIKDLRSRIIIYVDENLKEMKTSKYNQNISFLSEDNNIISDNYNSKRSKNWYHSPYWRRLMLHVKIIDTKNQKIEISKAVILFHPLNLEPQFIFVKRVEITTKQKSYHNL